MSPGFFFDVLFSICCFLTSESNFPADPRTENLVMQTQNNTLLTLVLFGLELGRPALRTIAPRALSLLRHRRRAIARCPDAATSE